MIRKLFETIVDRKGASPDTSYTAQLFAAGENRILRKVAEESTEVILAVKGEGKQRVIEESADLLYHLLVLLAQQDVSLDELEAELKSRSK